MESRLLIVYHHNRTYLPETSNVSCTNWMWYWVSLCWTCKETAWLPGTHCQSSLICHCWDRHMCPLRSLNKACTSLTGSLYSYLTEQAPALVWTRLAIRRSTLLYAEDSTNRHGTGRAYQEGCCPGWSCLKSIIPTPSLYWGLCHNQLMYTTFANLLCLNCVLATLLEWRSVGGGGAATVRDSPTVYGPFKELARWCYHSSLTYHYVYKDMYCCIQLQESHCQFGLRIHQEFKFSYVFTDLDALCEGTLFTPSHTPPSNFCLGYLTA